MKDLFVDAILPLLGVVAVVFGSTVLLFDLPPESARPPGLRTVPSPSSSGRGVIEVSAADGPATVPSSTLRGPVRETANEVMARALTTLGRAAGSESPRNTAEPVPTQGDPEVTTAMSAISEAVRAAREARTEADLLRAEETLHEARRRMNAACAKGGGPLCQSAQELERLGF